MHVISYVSTPTIDRQALPGEIENIVDFAQKRNKASGVTGVLFCTDHNFFQTIEGNEVQVREIYGSIEKDSRHINVSKLIDEPLDKRCFADWSLDTFFIDNHELINPETIRLLQAIYTRNFGMDTSGLIEFVKKMVDEMDTFKIKMLPNDG